MSDPILMILIFSLTLVALTAIGSRAEGGNMIAAKAIEVLKSIFR